jgi:dTDP-4-dehydrorhamnose reductase
VRVAVTGAAGRLGRALVEALESAPFVGPAGPIAWSRPDFDLDRPDGFEALLDRDRPEVVVHAAAWTDVDGCARDPDLAAARNGHATGVLAAAAALRGADLIVVSTNEVFDGSRTDGLGYRPDDPPQPANPYGASKLAAEIAATDAYGSGEGRPGLAIVRTAWLYGPPGGDFPDKIAAAAERARAAGQPLRVVGDEIGNPTSAADLAEAVTDLLAADAVRGVHHFVNAGPVSRADWAREVLRSLAIDVPIEEVSIADWDRPSRPPRWGVLEPTPTPTGEPLRDRRAAMADDLPWRRRARAKARARGSDVTEAGAGR